MLKLCVPKFWSDKNSKFIKFLEPISKLYSFISAAKLSSVVPEKLQVPVVCVGNIVLGGAGKTPTVELVCDILKKKFKAPCILKNGYGGYLKNVVRVDPSLHSYLQVGDEALLSANIAPTWIGKNRLNSAKAALLAGADVVIMDDGYQNNSIEKDLKILVVDSGQQFGNEHLIPAGPLRESVESGIKKSDFVLIIGEKNLELEDRIKRGNPNIPIFNAKMKVINPIKLESDKVVGFCGLGYPPKFKKTLIECGFEVIDFIPFSDHHPYTITEIQKLINAAKNIGAKLVTTMKDYVKIPEIFRGEVIAIEVKLEIKGNELKDSIFSSLKI
ncbi:MAG: tetraacyldisaccharide 4'-kinase [Holosporales bacterium]|nr:tetraacyldisaccharide 4'-kinase [Holosporales bacterium]